MCIALSLSLSHSLLMIFIIINNDNNKIIIAMRKMAIVNEDDVGWRLCNGSDNDNDGDNEIIVIHNDT